jgi:hypothetical protein
MFRLLTLPVLVVACMFAQPGIYGPASVHLKAGDFAPGVVFTRILHAGDASPWTSDNLSGPLTVLVFFPDTSHNIESVSRWNALVEKFSGKRVQFAWITGEDESSLLPWLQEHPVKGWVFHDPDGSTGRAYGIELPAAVIIGADRRIVGFDASMVPEPATLNAALDGLITTIRPQLTPSALKAFDESHMVLLSAEPPRIPVPNDHKPDFPPSYTVHISPSKGGDGGNFGGDTFHNFEGLTLKDMLAELYELTPVRIHLPPRA